MTLEEMHRQFQRAAEKHGYPKSLTDALLNEWGEKPVAIELFTTVAKATREDFWIRANNACGDAWWKKGQLLSLHQTLFMAGADLHQDHLSEEDSLAVANAG